MKTNSLCFFFFLATPLLPIPNTFSFLNNIRGKPRRGMLRRAVFSDLQRKGLEKMFQKQKYISKPDRKKLAAKLGLKDSQVRDIYYHFTHLRVFHTSVSWMLLTGVWVTPCFLESLRLFSVFWPILVTQLFRWSPLVLLFPSPPIPVSILYQLYRAHQLQLVSPSSSCFIVFFSSLAKFRDLSLFAFFQFCLMVSRNGNVHYSAGSLFLVDYH